MPKQRKNRRPLKEEPTGLPNAALAAKYEADMQAETTTPEQPVGRDPSVLLGNLNCPRSDDRLDACSLLTAFLDDVGAVAWLLDTHIAARLVQMLVDPDGKVAAAAANCLHELLLRGEEVEGRDVVEELGNRHIVVNLTGCQANLKSTEDVGLAAEFFGLLTQWCSDQRGAEAWKSIEGSLEFLLMGVAHSDGEVALRAAQCLLVLSQDHDAWRGAPWVGGVAEEVGREDRSLENRVTCAGCLIALDPAQGMAKVAGVLCGALDNVHPRPEVLTLVHQQSISDSGQAAPLRERWLSQTRALGVAFELLSDAVWAVGEGADISGAGDQSEEEVCRHHMKVFADHPLGQGILGSPLELPRRLSAHAAELLGFKDPIVATHLQADPEMHDTLVGTEAAFLVLFSNLVVPTPLQAFPDTDALWTGFCNALAGQFMAAGAAQQQGGEGGAAASGGDVDAEASRPAVERFERLAELILQVMSWLIRKDLWSSSSQPTPSPPLINIHVDHGKLLHTLCTTSHVPNDAKRYAVATFAACARRVTQPEHNLSAGQFLMSLLDVCPVPVLAEALDGLVDLYSDENFDGNVKQLNLVGVLKAFAPSFARRKVEYLASDEVEESVVAKLEMLHDNLPAFIEYKTQRLQ